MQISKQKIRDCWLDRDDVYVAYDDIEVKAYGRTIEVSQMYEYLPLHAEIMMELGEIFGTLKYRTNQESYGGCETCDYGSKYMHEFALPHDFELVE